jgi:hypothetical protein
MSSRTATAARTVRQSAAAALATLLLASAAQAGQFHFVIVFAFQAEPNLPRNSHTFATFIRAAGEGPRPEAYRLETHTISWYPAGGEVRAIRLAPDEGINLSLTATFQQARRLGARVCRWGPYQIRREFYESALAQEARLRSGQVAYKLLDANYRPCRAFNCIHALSDITAGPRLLDTGLAYGIAASRLVVSHFRPWIVNTHRSHEWVAARLGLSAPGVAWSRARPTPPGARPCGHAEARRGSLGSGRPPKRMSGGPGSMASAAVFCR